MCFNQGKRMGGSVVSCLILLHLLLDMFAQASEARQRMKENWEELAELDERSKQIELNEHMETAHLTKSDVHFQNYTFFEMPMEIAAPKLVAYHAMPYPYAINYFHYQEGENRVLQVPLKGENGDRVGAVAVCHMDDTSQWSPGHPSFQVLGIEPGTIPVCHFFPADDYVWIPVSTRLRQC